MRQLIVNADDLGADEARDDGIFEAIEAGVVTSVSILPNGPTSHHALQRLRSLVSTNVSPGIHLNLSEGRPVSSDLKLLIGPDGCFWGKARTQQLLMREKDSVLQAEITEEIFSQIRVLRDEGIEIRHLDGHQHVHVFPAVLKVAGEAAEKCRIPWARIPEEPPPSRNHELPDGLLREGQFFSRLAEAARVRWRGANMQTTDHFRGLYFKGRIGPSLLQEFVLALPEGLTELMVHPGRVPHSPTPSPFSNFSTLEREQELEALMHKSFGAALSKHGVSLVPFSIGGPGCAS
jgi:chitin disaccharide deacetylase